MLPTGAVKLVIEVGVTVTGALPVPARVIVCGLPAALSLIFRVAVSVPDKLGVNVTDSAQVLPPGKVPVHVFEGSTAKSPLFAPAIVGEENSTGMVC